MPFARLKQKFGITPKYRLFLAAGQVSLVFGIILWRLDLQLPLLNFFTGILIGFSTATNLAGMVLFTHSKKGKDNG